MEIKGPFRELWNRQTAFLAVAMLCVLASAIAVVYCKHATRCLHAMLQQIGKRQGNLQTEWSQLILEKSAWTSDARVEQVARDQLHMYVPKNVQVIQP